MVRSLDQVLLPRLRRLADQLGSGARILDVGAKKSPYRDLFAGCIFESVDIRPEESPDVLADIHDLSRVVAPDTYEVIICTEVLEHTRDPMLVLSEIRRALKPGGVLIASTPFIVPYHPDPTDYWRFTVEAWRLLLRDWKSAEIVPHGNQWMAIWYLTAMGWGTPLRLLDRVVYWLFHRMRPHSIFLGFAVQAHK